jgi:hypothetical protein
MTNDEIDAATAALDRALRDSPDLVYDDLANAVRHVVKLRDGLIAARRRGDGTVDRLAKQLGRVNTILSQMVGAEYPLDGIRRERIEKLRDQLTALHE